MYVVFFCKQKTAYEMRISDWSADVCSSDLANPSGRIADLRRSRRSASDSLRQYRADWLFGAVRWIDAGADYLIEHPPPKCLGHDADEGRAVSCASYRSEERRVGKEGVRTCGSRWASSH